MKFNVPKILTEKAREFRKKPTEAENILWHELKGRGLHGYKFRRQQPIERVIADFACLDAMLVIEVDG
jgi:very-short-patch-repair endonuclease